MKAEVIICKDCGYIFAVCQYDHRDKDWFKDVLKYQKQGHKVDVIEGEEVKIHHWCECK